MSGGIGEGDANAQRMGGQGDRVLHMEGEGRGLKVTAGEVRVWEPV